MTVTMPRGLSVSETAERTGLTTDTLRYYERIGLIDPVPRSSAGHRVYGEAQLEQVSFVLLLRNTGMPIRDMLRYARLRREGEHTAALRRALLESHRERLHAQVRELESSIRFLDVKIDRYGDVEHCSAAPG
ncbi:DNA-binding transcriptional MerR regulator [Lipingzhangella halophila]|uniref:DNA-binding transcriptional MerR regulator n=1 Tax=Lipingzhangella halophila TaxID=1783352 RepID=A0A7W7RHF4_9ACTN|nr:MerR family transcriptional regulator [Lipingzhangella halophila]MBB4932035.1 DNA-binding transcriptional MerR regulator [Lipingzhangella halophila]